MGIHKHGINMAEIYGDEFSCLERINFPDKIIDKGDKEAINILISLKTEIMKR